MAEILFAWNGRQVNLKLGRGVVRHLAENHGRLAEVGPTQCLRDILAWLKTAGPNDENLQALRQRFAGNADLEPVLMFLTAFDSYDDLKKQHAKQCGSLWMAVRGVMRKNSTHQALSQETSTLLLQQPKQEPTMLQQPQSDDDGAPIEVLFNPKSASRIVKDCADDLSHELLSLLCNPPALSHMEAAHLFQARQALVTAVGDLDLLLRHFAGQPLASGMDSMSFDDSKHGGGGSGGFGGPGSGLGGGGGGGGEDWSAPSTPTAPDSPGSFGSGGYGGYGSCRGAYSWYAGLQKARGEPVPDTLPIEATMRRLGLSDGDKSGKSEGSSDKIRLSVAGGGGAATEKTVAAVLEAGIQHTLSPSGFDRT